MDTARQLLDELMGRNRNLDPVTAQCRKISWEDPEFCLFYLVKFCPHDLFVNTRADLGPCQKLHDEEAKRLYDGASPSIRKRYYEDEFIRFSNHMLSEVDRKIAKGKQRLQLMNKGEGPAVYISKYQEHLNNLNARIRKLIGEAEEAGNRGDVDQAQGLMTLCDQLKEEKEALMKQHDLTDAPDSTKPDAAKSENGDGKWKEFTSSEKQMEVCEVCGAFLIVGDAQQRLEDHLSGKQHQGYFRLRQAVDEMYAKRKDECCEDEQRTRDDSGRRKFAAGSKDNKFSGRRREEYDEHESRRGSSGHGGGSGHRRDHRASEQRYGSSGGERREHHSSHKHRSSGSSGNGSGTGERDRHRSRRGDADYHNGYRHDEYYREHRHRSRSKY